MKYRNQNGFSVVELLLIFVIVVVIGFTGFRVYKAQQTANRSLDSSREVSTPHTPTQDNTPVDDNNSIPEDWVKYTNNQLGISFYHPPEWKQTIINDTATVVSQTYESTDYDAAPPDAGLGLIEIESGISMQIFGEKTEFLDSTAEIRENLLIGKELHGYSYSEFKVGDLDLFFGDTSNEGSKTSTQFAHNEYYIVLRFDEADSEQESNQKLYNDISKTIDVL